MTRQVRIAVAVLLLAVTVFTTVEALAAGRGTGGCNPSSNAGDLDGVPFLAALAVLATPWGVRTRGGAWIRAGVVLAIVGLAVAAGRFFEAAGCV